VSSQVSVVMRYPRAGLHVSRREIATIENGRRDFTQVREVPAQHMVRLSGVQSLCYECAGFEACLYMTVHHLAARPLCQG